MEKKGYKCDRWLPEHDKFIRDNYLAFNNAELALALNKKYNLTRTTDAVRKELNALKLRRPKKGDIKLIDKQVSQENFFKSIKKGLQKRKLLTKQDNQEQKKEERRQREIKWAKEFTGSPEEAKKPKTDKELVWITVDEKGTRMQVAKGTEEKWKKWYSKRRTEV